MRLKCTTKHVVAFSKERVCHLCCKSFLEQKSWGKNDGAFHGALKRFHLLWNIGPQSTCSSYIDWAACHSHRKIFLQAGTQWKPTKESCPLDCIVILSQKSCTISEQTCQLHLAVWLLENVEEICSNQQKVMEILPHLKYIILRCRAAMRYK